MCFYTHTHIYIYIYTYIFVCTYIYIYMCRIYRYEELQRTGNCCILQGGLARQGLVLVENNHGETGPIC